MAAVIVAAICAAGMIFMVGVLIALRRESRARGSDPVFLLAPGNPVSGGNGRARAGLISGHCRLPVTWHNGAVDGETTAFQPIQMPIVHRLGSGGSRR